MLLMTTTPGIDGRPAKTVLGIVSGEAVAEIKGFDRQAEQNVHDTLMAAMAVMSARAEKQGASAIVGVAFDIETLGPQAVRMVIATGTAVVL